MRLVRPCRPVPFHGSLAADRGDAQVTRRMLAAFVIATALTSLSPVMLSQSLSTTGSRTLHDLHDIGELRSLFDHERDHIRILLLLSPT
jgi:hypothetical protein